MPWMEDAFIALMQTAYWLSTAWFFAIVFSVALTTDAFILLFRLVGADNSVSRVLALVGALALWTTFL